MQPRYTYSRYGGMQSAPFIVVEFPRISSTCGNRPPVWEWRPMRALEISGAPHPGSDPVTAPTATRPTAWECPKARDDYPGHRGIGGLGYCTECGHVPPASTPPGPLRYSGTRAHLAGTARVEVEALQAGDVVPDPGSAGAHTSHTVATVTPRHSAMGRPVSVVVTWQDLTPPRLYAPRAKVWARLARDTDSNTEETEVSE
jgi:hypothetical protein